MDISQYKFHIFYFMLFMVFPLSKALYNNRRLKKFFMALTIFSTLLLYKYFDINFVSMETYRGTVRGFEISLLDLLVLALFLAIHYDKRVKKRLIIAGFWPNFIYICCAILSLYLSTGQVNHLYGYFAIFQYLRGLFYYWTLYHLIEDESDFHLLINAIICAAFFNGFVALQQRYIYHFHRIDGLFGHPNVLGAYSNMIAMFLLFIFKENVMKKRNLLVFVAACLSLVAIALSISRGAVAASIAGLTLILGTIYLGKSGLSAKKIAASLLIIFVIVSIWLKASDSIMARWTIGNPRGDQFRGFMNKLALQYSGMNLFGCGINNFSYASMPFVDEALPPAHSVYYLELAEMGYAGLAIFLLVWIRFISMGLRQFFVKRRSLISSTIKAATIACLVLLINSVQEDHPRRTPIMYLYFAYWAYIAKGTLILGNEGKQKN